VDEAEAVDEEVEVARRQLVDRMSRNRTIVMSHSITRLSTVRGTTKWMVSHLVAPRFLFIHNQEC
jgi:hypothetical protein